MSSQPFVAIIDYQMSNLFSVQHACKHVGLRSSITSDPKDLRAADGLILPGVGAFKDAMTNLDKLGLIEPILEHIKHGLPFMGICLGLQLLMTSSEEFGLHQGLNVIAGQVKEFPPNDPDGHPIKVPQIGWNTINPPAAKPDCWSSSPLKNVRLGSYMYFVHSFFVLPEDPNDLLCLTNYEGIDYCSGVRRDNVLAVQFHPEKSGPEGIKIYTEWAILLSTS